MQLNQYVWMIPTLPCLASILVGFGFLSFKSATRSLRLVYAFINVSMLTLAMLFSLIIFYKQATGDTADCYLWPWIVTDVLSIEIGYLVDPLSSIMLVLVTSVGVLVMIYSHGYMLHDQGYVRFFGYLSLFTASMLGLVLSPNLIQVYIFWELVGMCSYLLIGFWFTRPSGAEACQKAFITNRIGDFGLFLGILGLYTITGSFDFVIITERLQQLLVNELINIPLLTICLFLFFMGPIAKSAQFPLHVWLPDAMEGPTPISALIHAATMVAAGIFLVARILPVFQQIPLMMDIVAWIGGFTAFLGATIALAQRDLKRGLAYSTMSQLGYMMLGLGIGSYKAALFHLITHAYSKALLFLGSGSVIHSMEPIVGYNPNRSQDMGYMGGLRKYMPITGITFFIGTLSLCGIPPFACFWSKDEILSDTWAKFPILGWIALFTAGLTSFYMFRMYLLTFEGKFRATEKMRSMDMINSIKNYTSKNDQDMYPHESSFSMIFPLIVLAIPTTLIGLLGAPSLPNGVPGSDFLSSFFHIIHHHTYEDINLTQNYWLEFIVESYPSVSVASIGALFAFYLYGPNCSSKRSLIEEMDPEPTGSLSIFVKIIYRWSLNRAYIDKIYNTIFVSATRSFAGFISLVDEWVIDGAINTTGLLTLLSGESTKYSEGGRVTSYIFGLAFVIFILPIVFSILHLISV